VEAAGRSVCDDDTGHKTPHWVKEGARKKKNCNCDTVEKGVGKRQNSTKEGTMFRKRLGRGKERGK